jgi:DNA repair exonuclease SbcCD ATPase subunit
MVALVGQHSGKGSMYDDDELFSRLESRCILFPCFEMAFTHTKANAALKLLLEHTKALAKGKRFDCSKVKTAETRSQELQKALQERDAQIHELQSKMKELQQREEQLDEKQAALEELIAEAERKGADTSALQEKKDGLEAAKAELRAEA